MLRENRAAGQALRFFLAASFFYDVIFFQSDDLSRPTDFFLITKVHP